MPCACKGKKAGKSGSTHYSLPVYTVTPEYDRQSAKKMVASSDGTFLVDRNGVKINVSQMTTRIMFESEVNQLIDMGAPIYVYSS